MKFNFKVLTLISLSICLFGCKNENNEINATDLKINLSVCTPLNLEDENANGLFKNILNSFEVNKINYVSTNRLDKIGIELTNPKYKTTASLNLKLIEANGIRFGAGFYDKSNHDDDLEHFNLKKTIDNNGIVSFFDSLSEYDDSENKYDLIIDLNNIDFSDDLKKIISNKFKDKNHSSISVNIKLVNLNERVGNLNKTVKKSEEKKKKLTSSQKFKEEITDENSIPEQIITDVILRNLTYKKEKHNFEWDYIDQDSRTITKIPNYVNVYVIINSNLPSERTIQLIRGENNLTLDKSREDMELLKSKFQNLAKISLKIQVTNTKLNKQDDYEIQGTYRIACFTKTDCGFILNNSNSKF